MRYFSALFIILLSFSAFADDEVRVGRYTTTVPAVTSAQSDPLSVVVSVTFGPHIQTVGESLAYLLMRSGYRLADLDASDPYLPILLSRPLPQVHRHLGPVRLDRALVALAGSAWNLVVDPVNRLISYELQARYRPDSLLDTDTETINIPAASDRE